MSIESALDLEGMREAGRVTTMTLDALQAGVAEGVTTAELDQVALDVLRQNGARSAPQLVYGFPGTVLISVNDEIVHGIPGPRRLRGGDVVSLDVTIEKDGFIADAARSVIVGEGSDAARRLIAAAESSLKAALQVARAITLEATLSFLGLGVPITEPSLGLLISNGYQYLLSNEYWISLFPGLALLATIVRTGSADRGPSQAKAPPALQPRYSSMRFSVSLDGIRRSSAPSPLMSP